MILIKKKQKRINLNLLFINVNHFFCEISN
jgi:hypothetical protein